MMFIPTRVRAPAARASVPMASGEGHSPRLGREEPQVRVVAGNDLPPGLVVGPYISKIPLGANIRDERETTDTVKVHHRDGSLQVESLAVADWLPLVQSAHDRHEQNMEAFRASADLSGAPGRVFIRTLRPIQKGEELFVWYSDEFGRECGVPILKPGNIRGDQQYVCTSCNKCYIHPNTLKAHIRFDCPRSAEEMRPSTSLHLSPMTSEAYFRRSPPKPETLGAASVAASTSRGSPPSPVTISRGETSAFKPLATTIINEKMRESRDSLLHRQGLKMNKSVSTSAATMTTSKEGDVINRHKPMFGLDVKPDFSTVVGATHPVHMFGHPFPTPVGPIPLDHPAFRYYYPLYQRASQAATAQLCLAEHAKQMSLLHHQPLHPALYYPYALQKPQPSREDTEPLVHKVRTSPNADNHSPSLPMPYAFPMPSDKEGEPLDLLPRSLYMSKSRKGHLCIYCGKLYSRKYGLKIHLRTHTGYKPLKCKVCLRPFGDPSNLNKHIRLHAEGETPYRCDFCGKVLVRRRDLERHIKSRHPNETLKLDLHQVARDDNETVALSDVSDKTDTDGELSRDESLDDDEEEDDDDMDEIEVVS